MNRSDSPREEPPGAEPQEKVGSHDPADALADLAERAADENEAVAPTGDPQADSAAPEDVGDATAALGRMSGDQADAAEELDALADARQGPPDGAHSDHDLPDLRPLQGRLARRAVIDAQQARADAHRLRATMIPLLVVLGGLLIFVGVLGVLLLTVLGESHGGWRGHPAAVQGGGDPWHSGMKVVTMASFPLAAILFSGAWWFHRERSSSRSSGDSGPPGKQR